jgi:serine/threonine-protein kinase
MIGRFRVLELLGRGAMGVVYRGVDEILDRPVALKVMAGHGGDAEGRMRFKREAQAAARLQHPNIITIYELGEHQGSPFMALELLEGMDLQRAIEAGVRPDPKATLPVVLQVVAGLGHAHERGIVHRDIKPSNIFLPRRRPAKIMDFGVARLAGGITTAGMVVGTPNYMSPEQVRAGELDGRSDLFSVGLILYELVTGEKAFRGDSLVSLMYSIAHEDVDLGLIPKGAQWERLRAVLARALRREASERYPDARAMSIDLVAALADLGGGADWGLVSAISVASRSTQPRPLPTALSPSSLDDDFAGETIALGTAVPAFEAPMALGTAEEPAAGLVESPPAGRSPWPLAAGLVGAALLVLGGVFVVARRPTLPAPPVTLAAAPPVTLAMTPPPTPASTTTTLALAPVESAPAVTTPRATPPPGVARVDRADALLSAGRYAAALAEARGVLALEPRNDEAQQIAEEAEASLLIEGVLKNARAALSRGDKETAQTELRRGLAVNGNEARLLSLWREATQ